MHSPLVTSASPRARVMLNDLDAEAADINLTKRENEILQWSARGKSSWEIGKICGCSEAGVNYHFCNIRRKFGVSSRWIAVVKALEQGLIHLP